MAVVKQISDRMLERMKPGDELREASGLVARRRQRAVSFMALVGGKKVTLGRWPALSPAAARALLHRPVASGTETVDDLLDTYEAGLRRRKVKDPEQIVALITKHIRPVLGNRRLLGIARRDLQRLVDDLESASVAYRVGSIMRAAWRWGIKRGLVEHEFPVDLPKAGAMRQRVLTDEEMARLLADWWPSRSAFGPLFLLLLLTGCRRSEIAELRWTEVWDTMIVLSAERTKTGVAHTVQLSTFAQEVVASIPRLDAERVFPANWEITPKVGSRAGRAGRGFVSGFSPAVRLCSKRTGVTGWTPHDLRRTCATGLARLGTRPEVIERVLNHAAPRIARTYLTYDYAREMREALERWGEHVKAQTVD